MCLCTFTCSWSSHDACRLLLSKYRPATALLMPWRCTCARNPSMTASSCTSFFGSEFMCTWQALHFCRLYMASCCRTVDTDPNTLYKLNTTTKARTPMRCHIRISWPYICRRAAQGKITQTPFAGRMPTKSPMKATASLRSTTTMPERPRMMA